MKVLMQGKLDLLEVGGGDKVQIENTAKELSKLGVSVDIIPGFNVDYSNYDIIHLFQLDWVPETYLYAQRVKKAQKILVLSPIHHNIDEVSRFDTEYVFDFRRLSKFLFSNQFHRDTFKNVYRALFDKRFIYPTLVSLVVGLKNMQRNVLKSADMVLVQTTREAQDLKSLYNVDFRWKKVVNGVGDQFFNVDIIDRAANRLPFEDYIICIGRVEARKNQLKIIEAVARLREKHNKDLKLVFIGKKSTKKHFEYVSKFNQLIKKNPWITHISLVPYSEIPFYLKFAKVGVSASWFETTGLTSLEALFCGTNAVASGSRASEYLGENVSYCDPGKVSSIAKAIETEYFAPRPDKVSQDVLNYTWENAAKSTKEVYDLLLKNGF